MILPPSTSASAAAHRSGQWGWFALVAYVPDPQKSLLNSLRSSIPGHPLPPAHITVLPPRPLPFPIEQACSRVAGVAGEMAAFEAELSEVRAFSGTDFLYLDIAEGSDKIREIHEKLNVGDLNHPEYYEFRPHLTLGGPVPSNRLQAAQDSLALEWQSLACPRRIPITELVCLWLDTADESKEWIKVLSLSLKPFQDAPLTLAVEATSQRCSTGALHPDAFRRQET